jgi:ATP-dependent Clp protease ATP-binding subunit ClpB
MTSNLGAEFLANQAEGEDVEAVRADVMGVVRQSFRPEFLNRLDDILLFRRLGREQMGRIVEIQLDSLRKLLAPRHISLNINSDALAWLADKGYDPIYGARPLKRVIQTQLQNKLADLILLGTVNDGSKVDVTLKGGDLDFAVSGAEPSGAANSRKSA